MWTHLRGAHAVVVSLDVTQRAELAACDTWVAEARAHSPPGCPVAVVGCRTDLAERRAVAADEAAAHCGALQPPVAYCEDAGTATDALCDALVRAVLTHTPFPPPQPLLQGGTRPFETNENADILPEDNGNGNNAHGSSNRGTCIVC